jgi:hypothetical protein
LTEPDRQRMEEAIRLHWAIHFPGQPCVWKHRGGGDGVLNIDGHDIQYREHMDGKTLVINGGSTSPCFVLMLDIAAKEAVLQTLYKYENCFDDGYQDGRALVKAAYQLAKKYGIERLTLTDYSYIECPQKIFLADLSFLTTGQTWYESILPGLVCKNCIALEEYRNKVRSNTWRTVGARIKGLQVNGVDIDAPGSAMAVLNLMKKSGNYCKFFSEYMPLIREWSGIQSLHGTDWYCDIPQSLVLPTRRKTLKVSSRRAPSKRNI